MNIAVIPARGGSKRIPRKNIRLFYGQPLLAYSINAAMESNLFRHVIVSTDDHEIALLAREYGALTPFQRPPELATDSAGTMPVMRHAVQEMLKIEPLIERACCIYPTAPFLSATDLRSAYSRLVSQPLDYVFSASTFDYPIQRALRLTRSGVEMVDPDQRHARSQDLEEYFHDAGQFYWGTCNAWLNQIDVFSDKSQLLQLPRYRCLDIDTEEDWIMAELMYSALQKKKDNEGLD